MNASSPNRVRVHIERLVLDGVAGFDGPADRRRLETAVTAALAERLRDQPIGTPSWVHQERQNGGSMTIGDRDSPERLGTQVAGIVHKGLAR